MGIQYIDAWYEEKKENAKECYSKIGRIWCPILNDYIIFNQTGFRHMIRKGRRPRPKNDQIRRFTLLPFAKDIIESNNTKLIQKESDNISTHSWNFLAIIGKGNKQNIVIVIRQNRAGEKYFFSIYNQKIA
jgi:hypothetical protein